MILLDHGSLKLIEHWGSDERIVEAARMSTAKGFQGWGDTQHFEQCGNYGQPLTRKCEDCDRAPGDEKLLRYLYEHAHHTPFEMAGMIIEVQAPIFVFREWHRHRTQSYNELSARYTPLPDVNYIPSVERLLMDGGANKQAQSTGRAPLTPSSAVAYLRHLARVYELAEDSYQAALASGVPKELARLPLPVGRYSRMRASANLRNWLAFMTLRCDANAQWEIRQYAWAVAALVEEKFPRTYALWKADK